MKRGLAALVTCAAALAAHAAGAQSSDREERVAERIHSNLPLYTFDWEDLWPRDFHSEDSFGCFSTVEFGDWQLTLAGVEEEFEQSWERYTNYGVFHCAANIRSADERADLDEGEFERGYFVRLGEAVLSDETWELWAIQKGMATGSDYVLLARKPANHGVIAEFQLLQQRCPPGKVLEAEGMDIWRTRYCAINSREELLVLAGEMLQLAHFGTFRRVGEAIDEETGDGTAPD